MERKAILGAGTDFTGVSVTFVHKDEVHIKSNGIKTQTYMYVYIYVYIYLDTYC